MPKTAACLDSPREEEGVTDNNNNNDRRLRHRPHTAGDQKMMKGGDHSHSSSIGADSNQSEDEEDDDSAGVTDDTSESGEKGFDVKSDDDSEDSCLEIDSEESEEEDGDDGSWQGSDEENKINKKKGRSKAKGRKKKGRSIAKEAKERFAKDLEEGNTHGFISMHQGTKIKHGNPAHRVREILDGKKEKTDKYSVGYLESGGFFVKGTRSELDAFGEDGSKDGAKKPSNESWFRSLTAKLCRKSLKDDTEAVIFTTYKEGDDDIPAGCCTNKSMPVGGPAASKKNVMFTYYFYHPEFKPGFDALKLASFMKEDLDSDSDSD